MLILDLWGISFHAVVVFGLGKNLLFKSILGHCDPGYPWIKSKLARIMVIPCYPTRSLEKRGETYGGRYESNLGRMIGNGFSHLLLRIEREK